MTHISIHHATDLLAQELDGGGAVQLVIERGKREKFAFTFLSSRAQGNLAKVIRNHRSAYPSLNGSCVANGPVRAVHHVPDAGNSVIIKGGDTTIAIFGLPASVTDILFGEVVG